MKQTQKDKPGALKGKIKTIGLFLLILVSAGVLLFSASQILGTFRDRFTARNEYVGLRDLRPALPSESGEAVPEVAIDENAGDFATLSEINPDFVGWITIPDTEIDYPVVQGIDNYTYLKMTFEGNSNPVGSIFMDYQNSKGFEAEHVILYGHNVRDGSMFGGLASFTDAAYRKEHPYIYISLPDGAVLQYHIFSVRKVFWDDTAYRVSFTDQTDFEMFANALGATGTPMRILTLSTCTNSSDDTERILLHAELVS